MSIVSSAYEFIEPQAQADGRRYVKEMHTDSTGEMHVVMYLAPSGADYQAIANARALIIADQLAEAETASVING